MSGLDSMPQPPHPKHKEVNSHGNHSLGPLSGCRSFAESRQLGIERCYGSFYCAFTLPNTGDTENVAASYNAGVLKLELKKRRRPSRGRSKSR